MKIRGLLLFGLGYVTGTKAGRERYEQLINLARATGQRIDAYREEQSKGSAPPEPLDSEEWDGLTRDDVLWQAESGLLDG